MAKKKEVKYDKTDRILVDLAAEIVRNAKLELGTKTIGKNKNYGVASRTLQKNLAFEVKGKSLFFFANPPADKYAIFIHEGVNGTRVQRGSEFSYRDKQPPLEAIREWMRVKPIRLRDPKTGEFVKQTEEKLDAAAFMIGRSIKVNGIPGVPYFKNSMSNVLPKWEERLLDAMQEDVELAMYNALQYPSK